MNDEFRLNNYEKFIKGDNEIIKGKNLENYITLIDDDIMLDYNYNNQNIIIDNNNHPKW